jgi:hypothetical protein
VPTGVGSAEIAKTESPSLKPPTFPDGVVFESARFGSIETPERVYKNLFFERSDFYRTLIQNVSQPERQHRKHLS